MLMATSAASTAGTRRGTSPSSARGAKAARRRRLRAGRLFEQGLSQAEVARRLHTSPQNVSRWHAKWRRGGRAALAGPTRLGRPPRLSDSDWRRVERALLAGPQANGFDTELWTLPRVAEMARWVAEEWPRIKGGRQRGVRGSASWTSRARR